MHSLPEALGTRPGVETHPGADRPQPQTTPQAPPTPRYRRALIQLRWPLAVYAASRLLYLVIALGDHFWHHTTLGSQAANWDGAWYLALTVLGYPTHVAHVQTTLGFFPLYPITIWAVAHFLQSSYLFAGLLIATVGGFISTVLIQRLATGWWGEAAGRRAVLLFCLFPGSIIFSMVYSEGLMLPLVAGCILALERRRWLLAGVLAGVATATEPIALALIPVCAVSAFLELRRHGWRARRALLAPLLAPTGVVAFAAFLWAWTGTPFATYTAQHYGWAEHSHPLALVHYAEHLVHQIAHARSISHPMINLNYASGLIGAVFLAAALWLLARTRPRISPEALAWTLAIALLTLTSSAIQPNPRMLLCAFPAVLVFAYRYQGRAFARVIGLSTLMLVVMSTITFVGTGLRP